MGCRTSCAFRIGSALCLGLASRGLGAQVLAHQKISSTQGGFGAGLDQGDGLGASVAPLGDLDGDGVGDLAFGAAGDDDGAPNAGAVWLLFLEANGTVQAKRKISATQGGLVGPLVQGDLFGRSLAVLGDLDQDGVVDLAVGAPVQDTAGTTPGAVWVLFLDADGSVKAEQEIGAGTGGFGGSLQNADRFGASVTAIGDLDGDGVVDLAVGAPRDRDGGPARGAAWVLFLERDGTVKAEQKISDTQGGFQGTLADYDDFGFAVAGLGDLDGDGVPDLAVGAPFADSVAPNEGASWVLFLHPDGTVRDELEIAQGQAGFGGVLGSGDLFGSSLALLGDRDGDGVQDLAAGSPGDADGIPDSDAVWSLLLRTDGTVKAWEKISRTRGCFGALSSPQLFGTSLARISDLDGNGVGDLAVGDRGDNDGGPLRGAVWVLFLDTAAPSAEVTRLGNPPNPPAFLRGRTSAPIVGAIWDPVVDHTSFFPGATRDFVLVDRGPPLNQPLPFGTLLCALPPQSQGFFGLPGVPFSILVPNDCSLLGVAVCSQGGSMGNDRIQLANALDLVIGSF